MTKREILLIASCFLLLSHESYSKEFWGEGITWFHEQIKTIVQYEPEYEVTVNLPYQVVYRNIRGALTDCVITDNFRFVTGEMYTDIKSAEIYLYLTHDLGAILINIVYIEFNGNNKTLVKSWSRSIMTEIPSSKFISQKIEYAANHGRDADCLEFVEPVEEQIIPKL